MRCVNECVAGCVWGGHDDDVVLVVKQVSAVNKRDKFKSSPINGKKGDAAEVIEIF